MKKILSVGLAGMLALGVFAACGGGASSGAAVSSASEAVVSSSEVQASSVPDAVTFRVAGLKGPTTMGMVKLMKGAEEGVWANTYEIEMYGTGDEIVPGIVAGNIDIAAVPANLASVLYNRTDGAVQVAAINTLGVLYVLEAGEAVQSVEDLRGKTIYSTGQGTTPEFVLNYILTANGIDPDKDVTIEFKSEATEVAAMLKSTPGAIAVLPQPYATAVQMQNEGVRTALDLTAEWDRVSVDSGMVTGVLVARKEFVEQNPEAFETFLADYAASIMWVTGNVTAAAELVAEYGIVEKAAMAEKALPLCNIVYIDGEDMRQKLSGYLQVLFEQNLQAVGGALPGEDFYFAG